MRSGNVHNITSVRKRAKLSNCNLLLSPQGGQAPKEGGKEAKQSTAESTVTPKKEKLSAKAKGQLPATLAQIANFATSARSSSTIQSPSSAKV